ncbi:MAG: 4-alpha-glucanotransferase [Miltoncostaeaceae bacterium]|jgi:4-alpha-glucanotransferase|nr:4-alpha-glucanotransferase [Miltoncostaeaceae bacterium]
MSARRADPAAWGVATEYEDAGGELRQVPGATVDWILEQMGATPDGPPSEAGPVVLRPGGRLPEGRWRLLAEDGGEAAVRGTLPQDAPLGYHRLVGEGGAERALIVSPGRCVLPERAWGWAAQLYALRSADSWGMGDLADLRRLAAWAGSRGAGAILVNPLHADMPGRPAQPSPYSPSSRLYRNPVYLDVVGVAAALGASADLAELERAGRALNDEPRIDRDAVMALKARALEGLWAGFRGDEDLDAFRAREGALLRSFATFCALAERHRRPWWEWPPEHRRPGSPGVRAFAADHADRVAYHEWLQWLLERQLAAAGEGCGLLHDLAIGIDRSGADAWLWQDLFALGARVGAPPDEFNTLGQDWGIVPFDPWRLRAAGYEPVIRILRAALRAGAGIRVDHVIGLFRLFWIPEGAGPEDGGYVGYPWPDLLDILALESHRAGAYAVGEDLGTVAPFMREELAARDVLSYRLLWFEEEPPARFPERALAAVTTHDLPTVAGLWTGADLEEQRRLGLQPNEEGTEAIRERLAARGRLAADAPVDEVVEAAYRLLGASPSLVRVAALEDAALVEERPNVPGTVDERPNWSIPFPLALEELERAPMAERIGRLLSGGRPGDRGGRQAGGVTSRQ